MHHSGVSARGHGGQVAYLAGLAAEDAAERHFVANGYAVTARRYRGRRGEIDLILQKAGQIVFVEVKKSRSHEQAAWRMTPDKISRLYATGAQYLASQPDGLSTNCRFDVALVDALGDVAVLENALMQ